MFWRGGFDGATLDEVAAAVGVTKPTLCRTLGDKEAIFAAALEAYHGEHIEPAQRFLDESVTLREGLAAVLALFAERTLADDLPDGCFMGDTGGSGLFTSGAIAASLDVLQRGLVESVHGRVAAAIADGELDPGTDPASIVQYLLGQFAAISAISRSHPSRSELTSVVGYMLNGLPWSNPDPVPEPTNKPRTDEP